MIKQPALVRDRVLADVVYMLKHLRTMLTMLPVTEHDVLLALEGTRVDTLASSLANTIMVHVGDTEARQRPIQRGVRRKRDKPPKGLNVFENGRARKKAREMPPGALADLVTP